MANEYYMTRADEIAKFNALARYKGEPEMAHGSITLFEAMASDDRELFDALWSFWNFEHALDDLLDEGNYSAESRESVMAALERCVAFWLNLHRDGAADEEFSKVWGKLIAGCGWDSNRMVIADDARFQFASVLVKSDFIQRNAQGVMAMFVMCIFRCLDGDMMAGSPQHSVRALAPAVRCADVDFFIYLIYLKRGFGAARVWSERRDYDVADGVLLEGKEVGV